MAEGMRWDPTEFASIDEAARVYADADREFGMPRQAYPADDPLGSRINRQHYERDKAMNGELGWHGGTDAELRRRWNLE
ncbi:MAG TPA: hypothetical protein V6C81_29075 [Planktothrix sp.]|jgi:hypothetical protein